MHVAPDGRSAQARSRELTMTGMFESHGDWSEGIYENTFVKHDGVWKIQYLRFFPTFITDYDKGWAKDAQPAPAASAELPPDRPPTSVYAIYPKAHIPPFHYHNPVSGRAPRYPEARGRPSDAAIAAVRAPVDVPRAARGRQRSRTPRRSLAQAEQQVERVKDFHEIDNLTSAYGYYLDKNLWNDLANLFAADGSIELAQRGVVQRPGACARVPVHRVRQGRPDASRLGNHVQMQPVIHVAEDGKSAKIRSRMMQQLNFGPRASMGASIYENEVVKEDGVWKFSVDHTFNTWTAGYDGGWVRSPGRTVPGPSRTFPPDTPPTFTFQMFPTVYEIPFHYANPVTGRATSTRLPNPSATSSAAMTEAAVDLGMPPEIAAELRSIGAQIETQRTAELYAPLQPKEPYPWLTLTRDLKYGPHERNVLDVFTAPEPSGKPASPSSCSCTAAVRARREAHRRLAVLRQHRPLGRRRTSSSASP